MRISLKLCASVVFALATCFMVGCDEPKKGTSSSNSGGAGKDSAVEKKVDTDMKTVGKVGNGGDGKN